MHKLLFNLFFIIVLIIGCDSGSSTTSPSSGSSDGDNDSSSGGGPPTCISDCPGITDANSEDGICDWINTVYNPPFPGSPHACISDCSASIIDELDEYADACGL